MSQQEGGGITNHHCTDHESLPQSSPVSSDAAVPHNTGIQLPIGSTSLNCGASAHSVVSGTEREISSGNQAKTLIEANACKEIPNVVLTPTPVTESDKGSSFGSHLSVEEKTGSLVAGPKDASGAERILPVARVNEGSLTGIKEGTPVSRGNERGGPHVRTPLPLGGKVPLIVYLKEGPLEEGSKETTAGQRTGARERSVSRVKERLPVVAGKEWSSSSKEVAGVEESPIGGVRERSSAGPSIVASKGSPAGAKEGRKPAGRGQKFGQCPVCQRVVLRPNLRQHLRTHTGRPSGAPCAGISVRTSTASLHTSSTACPTDAPRQRWRADFNIVAHCRGHQLWRACINGISHWRTPRIVAPRLQDSISLPRPTNFGAPASTACPTDGRGMSQYRAHV